MKTLKAKYYLVPAAVCLIGLFALAYYFTMSCFSSQQQTQYVYIDEDDNVDSVFAKLQPYGKTHGMYGLRTMVRHTNYSDHIRTGRYAIEPDMSILNVLRRLKNGQQAPLMLTIPESRTMDRLAAVLGKKLMLDSITIIQAVTDSNFCRKWGYTTATIPALFVPNTYEVYWNVSLSALMQRMQREHDAFWNDTRRQAAKAVGLTPNEVVTLASIIDEETAVAAEKPTIAGMYLNRLRRGMLLQADPTVKFALGDFTLRRILNRHLEVESPYNTYKQPGLMPGPIRVPSLQAVEAVLHPAQHDYLYMCAKEDFSGTHNFATTLAEHSQNARRYQQALNQRGIR